MPSSAAVISALASVLVGLHRSGVFELFEVLSRQEPGYLPLERRDCRLFVDERLSPLREAILARVLAPERYLEYTLLVGLCLSALGFVAAARIFCRCCCCVLRRRSSAVSAVTLDFDNGSDRRIASRGTQDLSRGPVPRAIRA